MDETPTAQTLDPTMIAKLAAMFGKGGAPVALSSTAQGATPAAPTAPDSPVGNATGVPQPGLPEGSVGHDMPPPGASPEGGEGGLMSVLQNLLQLFQAKSGSASNDSKYQKVLTDAGMAPGETGIGR